VSGENVQRALALLLQLLRLDASAPASTSLALGGSSFCVTP